MNTGIKNFMNKCRQVEDSLNWAKFLPRPDKVNFTLQPSDWTATSDKYFADIAISGVTADDDATIDFDNSQFVSDAEIEDVGDSVTNALRIYAKNIPTGLISGVATITKGVSS